MDESVRIDADRDPLRGGDGTERRAGAIERDDLKVAAVLSGNRNFEARIHPAVRANYLASPPLVVAFESRIVEVIDGRVRFTHPLLGSILYADTPLPIGFDKTISQPFIVALMTDLLDLNATDAVLEIGTGLGYQAAILAELARV